MRRTCLGKYFYEQRCADDACHDGRLAVPAPRGRGGWFSFAERAGGAAPPAAGWDVATLRKTGIQIAELTI